MRGLVTAKYGWVVIVAIVVVASMALLWLGRSPICPCGTVRLWQGVVESPENSQQLSDWYSLSHIVHGLLFYGATWLVLRRWPVMARLILTVTVEASWEVLENSPIIIDRYRAVTMAWGYSGDSVLNSVSDIAMMILGFAIARRGPVWGSIALGLALELIALAAIRDNLTLNVWMLIAPNEAVRRWQTAG